MSTRNRNPQTTSLNDRLAQAAIEARKKAQQLEPGPERDKLLAKANQFETQIGVNAAFKG